MSKAGARGWLTAVVWDSTLLTMWSPSRVSWIRNSKESREESHICAPLLRLCLCLLFWDHTIQTQNDLTFSFLRASDSFPINKFLVHVTAKGNLEIVKEMPGEISEAGMGWWVGLNRNSSEWSGGFRDLLSLFVPPPTNCRINYAKESSKCPVYITYLRTEVYVLLFC